MKPYLYLFCLFWVLPLGSKAQTQDPLTTHLHALVDHDLKPTEEKPNPQVLVDELTDALAGTLASVLDALDQKKPFLATGPVRAFFKRGGGTLMAAVPEQNKTEKAKGYSRFVPALKVLVPWFARQGIPVQDVLTRDLKGQAHFQLQRALEKKDHVALGQALDLCLWYPEGRKAAVSAVSFYRTSGHTVAAVHLARLLLAVAPGENTQAVITELLLSELALGRNTQASRLLGKYRPHLAGKTLVIKGQKINLEHYIQEALSKKTVPWQSAVLGELPMYRGHASGVAQVSDPGARVPRLAFTFAFAQKGEAKANHHRFLGHWGARKIRQGAPNIFPVVLGDMVHLFDGHVVHSLSLQQGKRMNLFEPSNAHWNWTPDRVNVFERDLYLTSDGHQIWAPYMPYRSADEKGQPGLLAWSLPRGQKEKVGGKLRWSSFTKHPEGSHLALSPGVVPAGGQLFCPAVQNFQDGIKSVLVACSGQTGAPLWQSFCAYRLKVVGAFRLNIRGRAFDRDPLRHGGLVACDSGMAFFCSQVGTVSGLQQGDGRRLWTVRYPSVLDPDDMAGPGVPWQTGAVLCRAPYLYVAPRDGRDLMALSMVTGKVLWRFRPSALMSGPDPKEGDLSLAHVLGLWGKYLVVAAGTEVYRIDLEKSRLKEKPVFDVVTLPGGAQVAGMGVLTPRRCLVPTQQGVVALSLEKFAKPFLYWAYPEGQEPGNLLLTSSFLFITTRHNMSAYRLKKLPPAPKSPKGP